MVLCLVGLVVIYSAPFTDQNLYFRSAYTPRLPLIYRIALFEIDFSVFHVC